MKPIYADYVRHMMRLYVSGENDPDVYSSVDRLNRQVCEDVMKSIGEPERSAILAVYKKGSFRKNISEASAKFRIDEEKLWRIVKLTEKTIAHQRKLI